jgi:triosephosphate isomerase
MSTGIKLVGGNWKMNGSREFVNNFFEHLSFELKGKPEQACGVDIFIAVPHILIPLCVEAAKRFQCAVTIAAQNVYFEEHGAYTGETR